MWVRAAMGYYMPQKDKEKEKEKGSIKALFEQHQVCVLFSVVRDATTLRSSKLLIVVAAVGMRHCTGRAGAVHRGAARADRAANRAGVPAEWRSERF